MSLFTVLATSKVAAGVLAAGTIAVGGTGAAAVSGVLPAEAQQTAHNLFGAPAPKAAAEAAADAQATAEAAADAAAGTEASAAATADAEAAGDATVTGDNVSAQASASAGANTAVDAAGAAAFGLCTAFTNGGLNASSEGFSSLVIAAEGEANIDSFCTAVVAEADAATEAGAAATGSAAVDVELPEAPAVPAVPAVPGVDGEPAVPAVPAVSAEGGSVVVDAPSVSAR
jgi:hypothetical protein